jgi:SAM-dependent methyltransferase
MMSTPRFTMVFSSRGLNERLEQAVAVMSDDRTNVHRWVREAQAGTRNRYHPFNPRGLYGQSYQRERFVRLIVENEIPLDQMEILDLGCGTGTWCRYFAELKGTNDGITGVDVSPERLSQARSLSPIDYVEGDITRLPSLFSRQFDFVTAFVSLMFLRDPSELHAVFLGVHELLRPGGYFYVYERDGEHDPKSDASGWPLRTLASEAHSAGFEVVVEQRLHKVLLGHVDPIDAISFKIMDLWRVAERIVPGRWAFYAFLARKAG